MAGWAAIQGAVQLVLHDLRNRDIRVRLESLTYDRLSSLSEPLVKIIDIKNHGESITVV